MSPEQAKLPAPPVAGGRPASTIARPVATEQVTASLPSRPSAPRVIMATAGSSRYRAFSGDWISFSSSAFTVCLPDAANVPAQLNLRWGDRLVSRDRSVPHPVQCQCVPPRAATHVVRGTSEPRSPIGTVPVGGSPVNIRAVIFDYFGTLTVNVSALVRRSGASRVAAALGVPADIFFDTISSTFTERATGKWRHDDNDGLGRPSLRLSALTHPACGSVCRAVRDRGWVCPHDPPRGGGDLARSHR